jgi:hypothetical protein
LKQEESYEMALVVATQFGLFQGPENIKVSDAKLSAHEKDLSEIRALTGPQAARPLVEIRRKILCGFLGLHFREDPEMLLKRSLHALGGRTLESLLLSDWNHAYAWTQEYRIHPEEKHLLIAEGKK